MRTHDPTQTGGISEARREAYRRAQHAAKLWTFLDAMFGMTPRQIDKVPFGRLCRALADVAAGRCTPNEAVKFLTAKS